MIDVGFVDTELIIQIERTTWAYIQTRVFIVNVDRNENQGFQISLYDFKLSAMHLTCCLSVRPPNYLFFYVGS